METCDGSIVLEQGHSPEDTGFFVLFRYNPHPYNRIDDDNLLLKMEMKCIHRLHKVVLEGLNQCLN